MGVFYLMSKKKITAIVAIMLLAFLSMSSGATTPALASIGEAFPNIDHSTLILLSTLPMLLVVPFSMLSGKLVGYKVKYRTLALIGLTIISVAGLVPFFLNSFYGILVARAFSGVGVGLVSPLANTLILNLFEGKTRDSLMGMSRVLNSAGGMTFQLIGGVLCSINWRYTFFAYSICVLGLVLIFFMLPEPPKMVHEEVKDANGKVSSNGKGGLGAVALIWISLYALMTFFTYPFYINMSSLVAEGNLGTAATSGFILTLSSLGGIIGSSIFGMIFRYLKQKIVPIGFVLCIMTFGIMLFFNSVVAFAIASFLCGFGFGLVAPAINIYTGLSVSPASRGFAMALMMALPNLAMFLTSYFFAFIKSTFNITYDRFMFIFAIGFYIIVTIVFSFVKIGPKEDKVIEDETVINEAETEAVLNSIH